MSFRYNAFLLKINILGNSVTSLQSVNGYWYLLIITLGLLIYLVIEAIRHHYYLKKIPIRIHVNGTRGKSSVTSLIAAGLRGGGISTFAKTTGTLPRMIFPDGSEKPIFRIGHTNILEQLKVIRTAVKNQADALVIECMAVHPLLQSLAELKLVKSTHGVLTNARPDHLDVMGPTEEDVALALAGTMPVKGHYFTTENKYINIFKMAAKDRKSVIYHIDPIQVAEITESEIKGFSYAEYKENLALALAVCKDLGVNHDKALKGMWEATPDPGAMSISSIEYKNHFITFANGFAANDPFSTWQLWHNIVMEYGQDKEVVALVNCRNDRRQRSQQIGEAFVGWRQPHRGLVIGSSVQIFLKTLVKKGGDLKIWTEGENWNVQEILDFVISENQNRSHLVIGIANIAGVGLELVDFFNHEAQEKHDRPPNIIDRYRASNRVDIS